MKRTFPVGCGALLEASEPKLTVKIRPQGNYSPANMGSEKFPGWAAYRGWKRARQRNLYHKIELDALCQNMLQIWPQGTWSPAYMGSKNLPGGVAERGWMGASQSKLYHKVEFDALCQNILKIRLQGNYSTAKMGSKNFLGK